jgi:hypothetical protein
MVGGDNMKKIEAIKMVESNKILKLLFGNE